MRAASARKKSTAAAWTFTAPPLDKAHLYAAIAISLLAIAARSFVAWKTHSTGEDALITLRYAENLAAGHGFAYNIGEHVLGVTTPLYCLLLSLFCNLHLDAMAMGKACNIAADGVTCFLIARLFTLKEIDRPIVGLFAASIYAFTSTPISVSISGMETGIVTCVSFAMIYAYASRSEIWLYTLGAVLVLLRIDGLLLFSVLAIGLILRTKRLEKRSLAVAAIILLPWLLYSTLVFGSPIPTSLVAKITVYSHPSFAAATGKITPTNMAAFVAQFAAGWPQRIITVLFALGAIMLMLMAAINESHGLFAPALWAVLYFGVMLSSRVPAFPWYFLPPWPVVVSVACLAGSTAPKRIVKLSPEICERWAPKATVASIVLLLLLGVIHVRAVVAEVDAAQRIEDYLRKPIGLWLKDNVAGSDRVMLEPIGYIGYYSRCRILDTIGLVSPEVLPSYRKPGNPRADIILRLQPEWLCLRKSEVKALEVPAGQAQPVLDQYRLIHGFEITGAEPFSIYRRMETAR